MSDLDVVVDLLTATSFHGLMCPHWVFGGHISTNTGLNVQCSFFRTTGVHYLFPNLRFEKRCLTSPAVGRYMCVMDRLNLPRPSPAI